MEEINYDKEKVDEVAMALLYLTLGDDYRAWKGMDWDVSNRLYEKGWIADPKNKNKSFALTHEGYDACHRLFKKHFGIPESSTDEADSNP